jgi:CDP-glycerol glycerophosphotransferase
LSYINKTRGILKEKGVLCGILILFFKMIHKIFFKISDKFIYNFASINEKRLVFESNKDFSDNARALFDYLVENKYNEKYQMIWLVSNSSKFNNYNYNNVVFVNRIGRFHLSYTLRALYYARTCKIYFFTHSSAWLGKKRGHQIFINLWHGSGYKAAKGGSENIIFDYCLVPGEVFIKTKKEFFQCPEEKIIPLGYPRYDWFNCKKKVLDKLYIHIAQDAQTNSKTIIWMPTYRKSKISALSENTLSSCYDLPIIYSSSDLNELNKWCKKYSINIIIKQHIMQKEYSSTINKYSNLFLLTDNSLDEIGIQLYELLACVDGLISDYSSVAIDFLLVDKPIGFILDDYQNYKKDRGFIFENPLEYMPGHHIYTMNDLILFLEEVSQDNDKYKMARKRIRGITHNPCDNYSKRITEYFGL